jgi:hypothetical protein
VTPEYSAHAGWAIHGGVPTELSSAHASTLLRQRHYRETTASINDLLVQSITSALRRILGPHSAQQKQFTYDRFWQLLAKEW